jgi:hypothetical protein
LVRGQNFTVTGLGAGKYCELLAATCLNGGPHVSFESIESDAPLVRKFKIHHGGRAAGDQRQDARASFPVKEDTRS